MHEARIRRVGEAQCLGAAKACLTADQKSTRTRLIPSLAGRSTSAASSAASQARAIAVSFAAVPRVRAAGVRPRVRHVGHEEVDGAMPGEVFDGLPDAERRLGQRRRRIGALKRASDVVAAAEHDVKRIGLRAGEHREQQEKVDLPRQAISASPCLGAADGEIGATR